MSKFRTAPMKDGIRYDSRGEPIPNHDQHVMPVSGEHRASPECWCKPRIEHTDTVNEGRIWVHKAPA